MLRASDDNNQTQIGKRFVVVTNEYPGEDQYLTIRNSTLFNQLLDKREECKTLRQRLAEHKIDHT